MERRQRLQEVSHDCDDQLFLLQYGINERQDVLLSRLRRHLRLKVWNNQPDPGGECTGAMSLALARVG